MGVLVQIIGAVILSFSGMNMGINSAWPSSTLHIFKSENTTLHRPMTDLEFTLFSSLPILGTFIAQPFINVGVLPKMGIKHTALMTTILFVVAWSIIAVSKRVEAILFAVVINGFGNSVFAVIVMYISEITQDSIRGTLTSGPNISICLGFLVSYIAGGILEYHTMIYFCISLAVIGHIMIAFLKDSPVQLMARGKEEEAVKSLMFYRQASSTSTEVLTEITNIRRSLTTKFEDGQTLLKDVEEVKLNEDSKKATCWQLFKSTSSIRRQFYLVLVLETAYMYQGLPFILVYAEPIFAETVGDYISSNLCSVLLGLVTLVAGIVAAYLTDKVGRKPLQIHSSIVSGFCCLFLGTQVVTEWFPMWTIPVVVYAFAVTNTVGTGTVPCVVSAEIFIPEVKSQLLMIVYEWGYICCFSCLFLFDIVVQCYGLAPAFYFFSFVCFSTTVYFFYFLPETKGLPVYAIQELFTNKR